MGEGHPPVGLRSAHVQNGRRQRMRHGLQMFYKAARVEYVPVGVVGAIVPWNYPFHNVFNPLVAALYAGNAIVIKAYPPLLPALCTRAHMRARPHLPLLCVLIVSYDIRNVSAFRRPAASSCNAHVRVGTCIVQISVLPGIFRGIKHHRRSLWLASRDHTFVLQPLHLHTVLSCLKPPSRNKRGRNMGLDVREFIDWLEYFA